MNSVNNAVIDFISTFVDKTTKYYINDYTRSFVGNLIWDSHRSTVVWSPIRISVNDSIDNLLKG